MLFCRILLPGVVQNSTQHLFVVPYLAFFLVVCKVVQPCYSSDTTTAWKDSCFLLSGRSDFHMIVNLSIEVHALPMHMLTSFSVDEILLQRYLLI